MGMQILPGKRPQWSRDRVRSVFDAYHVNEKIMLLGVRGYYRDTMGEVGVNDRKLYDDAMFLVLPGEFFSYNANVDPGAYRKGIASLLPGLWKYKVGVHGLSKPKEQRYTALVQAAPVKIKRDEEGISEGFFGINIHKGSRFSVSSLGCQTIFPSQWSEFLGNVRRGSIMHSQSVFPYLLIEYMD